MGNGSYSNGGFAAIHFNQIPGYKKKKEYSHAIFDSPAEELFYKYAEVEGIKLQPQFYPIYGDLQRADFRLLHPILNVLIEIDGHTHHSTKDARMKDSRRERKFQALGWTIVRFAGKEAMTNAPGCIIELKKMISCLEKFQKPEIPEQPTNTNL